MNILKKLMVVLLSAFMFLGLAATPVSAKGNGGRGQRPSIPEQDPTVEPDTEQEADEEKVISEELVLEEETVIEEEAPAAEEIEPEEVLEVEESEEPIFEIDDEARNIREGGYSVNAVEDDAPAHSKELIDNGDGTYTIALNVTGAASSSSTTTVTKSNIVLVLDTSNSMNMNNTTYNGRSMSRMNAEKTILTEDNGIIDKMLEKNTEKYPDIIEVAVVDFGTAGVKQQDFTYNGTTLKSTINGLATSTGTNWEEGLQQAKSYADEIKAKQPDEEVYVIFMTDGEPTNNATNHSTQNNTTGYQNNWTYASDDARNIVEAGYHFYGIFTWGSSSSTKYLSSLVQYAYTGTGDYNSSLDSAYASYFTDASDSAQIVDALAAIVNEINTSVGYTNVELADGVTTMTASSVSATADGEVTGVKYYRSGGNYSTTANNGLGEEWADAPEATIKDGKVDWDLDDMVLEDGVTYTITFVVWPSQASLDLVADLNNGLVKYDDLTADQKASITITGGTYALKTNTDYPTVTYSTVTTTTENGVTTTVVSDPTTINITNPDPVGLAGSGMKVRKIWASQLQNSRLNNLLYNEDGSSRKLTVTLNILKDGEVYDTVTLGWVEDEDAEEGGYYAWADANKTIWEDEFAVAPGVMTTNADMAQYAKSTYTYNGKTYYVLETGHDYDLAEKDFKDYHFDLVTETCHPMIVDGEVKNVKFTYSESGAITGIESVTPEGEELSALEATNTLRGGINLNKVILDPEGNEFPLDDEFTFTIALNNEAGLFTGDSIPWYSVNGNYYHNAAGEYISEDEAKELYGDNYEQYGNILSGSGASVQAELTITCVDTVRIANVPIGTTYTITEAEADGYTLNAIEYTVQLDGAAEDRKADISLADRKIEAEIVPNRENNVTFKNQLDEYPYFYVYHSKDNTVEKIDVGDDRVIKTVDENTGFMTYKFDIVAETKANSLYGGYYSDYAGKSAGYDSTKVTAWDEDNWYTDASGKPYSYDNIETNVKWDYSKAYDVSGFTMTPVMNETYYLKEVPTGYLQPYTQYTYYRASFNLANLYEVTAIDDLNYENAGFIVQTQRDAKIYRTLTIKAKNSSGKSTLKPETTFKAQGIKKGYLGYADISDVIGTEVTGITQFWDTKDNVRVFGIKQRKLNNGKTIKTFKKTDTAYTGGPVEVPAQ